MEYVTLNNGVKMPMVGLGTWQLPGNPNCEEIITAAIREGYRLIDTAQNYGSEPYVGRAVERCGVPREELFITTKLWFENFEREDAERSLYASMEKLRVDYLDLVLLHWPFGNVYEGWRTLERFYEAGRIRAIGISNFSPARMVDLIHYNRIKPCVNQIETHLFCQQKQSQTWMKKYGVSHQAFSPLSCGRAKDLLANETVTAIAAAHGKTPGQVALRFLVQNGISLIAKSAHVSRLRENLDIFGFSLTEEEMAALSALDQAQPVFGTAENPETNEDSWHWN